jgi:hypothetical protein
MQAIANIIKLGLYFCLSLETNLHVNSLGYAYSHRFGIRGRVFDPGRLLGSTEEIPS